jgi:uncharacterized membrane protein YeaQ/YmgE (transglycosylase-associated protein family)
LVWEFWVEFKILFTESLHFLNTFTSAIVETNNRREVNINMGILLWIIFGALAGWIASLVMKTDNAQGTLTDIILGVVGALVGGFLMNLVGEAGVTGFNIYSLFVAVLGASVLIWLRRRFA